MRSEHELLGQNCSVPTAVNPMYTKVEDPMRANDASIHARITTTACTNPHIYDCIEASGQCLVLRN
jgi:hypothetical protein